MTCKIFGILEVMRTIYWGYFGPRVLFEPKRKKCLKSALDLVLRVSSAGGGSKMHRVYAFKSKTFKSCFSY